MSTIPSALYYSKEHEWVEVLEGNLVKIGITHYAQEQLGDVVFVENAELDDDVTANETMGTVESVKSVSDIYSPVSGSVTKVNESLEDSPEKVNESPYDEGWLVEVQMSDLSELEQLMSAHEYKAHTGGE